MKLCLFSFLYANLYHCILFHITLFFCFLEGGKGRRNSCITKKLQDSKVSWPLLSSYMFFLFWFVSLRNQTEKKNSHNFDPKTSTKLIKLPLAGGGVHGAGAVGYGARGTGIVLSHKVNLSFPISYKLIASKTEKKTLSPILVMPVQKWNS